MLARAEQALKVIGFILFGLLVIVAAAGTYVNVALPDTGAAPQIEIERTAERIKCGEYLTNHVSVCMDCHSTKDESLYGSPVVGGFGGWNGSKDIFIQRFKSFEGKEKQAAKLNAGDPQMPMPWYLYAWNEDQRSCSN